MKYLRIRSAGEIEPEAISLMGASTKRGDESKVGMFGSGNKFALAYFIRSGITPIIYSGVKRIQIGHVETTFRGEKFDVITVDGKETSLTTSMGKDWKCWMAIREVYANAIDEGDESLSMLSSHIGKKGTTSFYIPVNDDVQTFFNQTDDYFSFNRPVLAECEFGKVYEGSKCGLTYRKGIRVSQDYKPSIFDYDIFDLEITEDRIARYSWEIQEKAFKIISSFTDPVLINRFLNEIQDRNYLESDPSCMVSVNMHGCPPIWDEMMAGLYFCPRELHAFVDDPEKPITRFVSGRIHKALAERFGNEIMPPCLRGKGAHRYKIVNGGEFFSSKINKAVEILVSAGVHVDKYPIHTAEFADKNVLGEADTEDNTIILSDKAMSMGLKQIAITILEEFIHLDSGAKDETRAFQDASLTLCLTLVERIAGIEL